MTDARYNELVHYLGKEKADVYRWAIHHGDLKPLLKLRKKERECKEK